MREYLNRQRSRGIVRDAECEYVLPFLADTSSLSCKIRPLRFRGCVDSLLVHGSRGIDPCLR